MPPKDIVARMMDIYKVQNVNWKLQMKIANQLLEKYSEEQIMYALKYYKTQSINMYSLGYLTYKNNMDAPISMLKAMKNFSTGSMSGRACILLNMPRKSAWEAVSIGW
jgi:hypothetical protein